MVIRHEQLSALMDDELDAAQEQQLVRQWSEGDTARCWNDYHLIGDILREQEIQHVCLTRRISEALQREPVVLAPKRRRSVAPPRWLAVAATVAAVSLTTWGLHQPAADPVSNVALSTTTAQPAAAFPPASDPTVLAQKAMDTPKAGLPEHAGIGARESRTHEPATVAATGRMQPTIAPEPVPEVATQLASQAAEPYVALHRQWSTLSGFQTVDYETGPASGR